MRRDHSMGPILGGIKQYKQCNCMVNLRDFPLMVHRLRVGNKRISLCTRHHMPFKAMMHLTPVVDI